MPRNSEFNRHCLWIVQSLIFRKLLYSTLKGCCKVTSFLLNWKNLTDIKQPDVIENSSQLLNSVKFFQSSLRSDLKEPCLRGHRCQEGIPVVCLYNNVHFLLFFLTGGGQRTARMASSNTVFRPRCVNAEHSRYFTAPGEQERNEWAKQLDVCNTNIVKFYSFEFRWANCHVHASRANLDW